MNSREQGDRRVFLAFSCPAIYPSKPRHLLHDGAAATTALLTIFTHIHLRLRTVGSTTGTTGRVACHFFVVSTDFTHNIVEGIVDVGAGFG